MMTVTPSSQPHILLTGGAGYIGSHVAVVLLEAGHDVTILDNFANSSPAAIARIEEITGCKVGVIEADLSDRTAIASIVAQLKDTGLAGAVHLAGLKARRQPRPICPPSPGDFRLGAELGSISTALPSLLTRALADWPDSS